MGDFPASNMAVSGSIDGGTLKRLMGTGATGLTPSDARSSQAGGHPPLESNFFSTKFYGQRLEHDVSLSDKKIVFFF